MHYENILKAFFENNIRYLVVGGLAINLHGVPRLTVDLDIIIDLHDNNITKLLSTLDRLGFKARLPIDAEDLKSSAERDKWVKQRNMIAFSFVNEKRTSEELDVLLVYPLSFEDAYNNRIVLPVDDYEIPLIDIDELQRMKKNTGRAQDEADVEMLERVKNDIAEK